MALSRDQIRAAQRALNGWWEVTPKLIDDGIFGSNTSRGVRQFQKRVGLPETGQLDAATLARLGVVGGSASGSVGGSINVGSTANVPAVAALAAAAGFFGVSPSAIIAFVDNKARRYAVPANATVMIQDSSGGVKTVAASAAQSVLNAGGSVLGVAANGADITSAAQSAGNGGAPPDKPKPDYSKYLLYGGILLAVLLLTGD